MEIFFRRWLSPILHLMHTYCPFLKTARFDWSSLVLLILSYALYRSVSF
jgi:hypothetical protein